MTQGVIGCNTDCISGAKDSWVCTGGDINTPSTCYPVPCPNGFVDEDTETCDDDNEVSNDGCSEC